MSHLSTLLVLIHVVVGLAVMGMLIVMLVFLHGTKSLMILAAIEQPMPLMPIVIVHVVAVVRGR